MLREDVVKEVDYLASTRTQRTQRTQRTGFLTCLVNSNPWVGNKTCELFQLFRWDMNCGTCLAKMASHNDDNWFQRTNSKKQDRSRKPNFHRLSGDALRDGWKPSLDPTRSDAKTAKVASTGGGFNPL